MEIELNEIIDEDGQIGTLKMIYGRHYYREKLYFAKECISSKKYDLNSNEV